ncbi:MAG TPA: hypothetical protein VIM35_05760 [Gallionella sp.]
MASPTAIAAGLSMKDEYNNVLDYAAPLVGELPKMGRLLGSSTFSYPQISCSQKDFTEETQQAGNQRKHGRNEKQ